MKHETWYCYFFCYSIANELEETGENIVNQMDFYLILINGILPLIFLQKTLIYSVITK